MDLVYFDFELENRAQLDVLLHRDSVCSIIREVFTRYNVPFVGRDLRYSLTLESSSGPEQLIIKVMNPQDAMIQGFWVTGCPIMRFTLTSYTFIHSSDLAAQSIGTTWTSPQSQSAALQSQVLPVPVSSDISGGTLPDLSSQETQGVIRLPRKRTRSLLFRE